MQSSSRKTGILGITGGMGAGKSVVARILSHLQIPCFDTDQEAKNLYTTLPRVRPLVEDLLGEGVYLPNGQPCFATIAKRTFSNPSLLKQLEQLIHPLVKEQLAVWQRTVAAPKNWVAIESAILIEKDFDLLCDAVLLVTAPEEIRIQRVQQRSALPIEEIRKRINQQNSPLTSSTYNRKPLFVIENVPNSPIIPSIKRLLYHQLPALYPLLSE